MTGLLPSRELACSPGSDGPDVLRFLALATGGDVELDLLALLQRAVAAALDVGVMDENVVALLAGDEAEALLGVEELHGTCCHDYLFSSGERVPLTSRHQPV